MSSKGIGKSPPRTPKRSKNTKIPKSPSSVFNSISNSSNNNLANPKAIFKGIFNDNTTTNTITKKSSPKDYSNYTSAILKWKKKTNTINSQHKKYSRLNRSSSRRSLFPAVKELNSNINRSFSKKISISKSKSNSIRNSNSN